MWFFATFHYIRFRIWSSQVKICCLHSKSYIVWICPRATLLSVKTDWVASKHMKQFATFLAIHHSKCVSSIFFFFHSSFGRNLIEYTLAVYWHQIKHVVSESIITDWHVVWNHWKNKNNNNSIPRKKSKQLIGKLPCRIQSTCRL